jgi:aminoglycoside/choline kinase family phosphotransferase
LWKRDGKPRYLDYIPRVWAAMERDLAHPALAPVAAWFDANIPADVRAASGGTFAV